ncbi:MAG: D-alanyl-D-alanine carboxypeptidase [Eubacterium sp.]|nr:D-alanyl-D-alanine carboxypeptidase [Eubacterium sp.]
MLKKMLLGLTIFLSAVGIVALILLSVKLVTDEYERKEDEKREEFIRQEEASREEERRLEEEKRREEEERLAREAETATESPEEIEARYWEEWENPIATASDAEFNYVYHSFEYTDKTIELKPYEEVYEEVKAGMIQRGEEIRTEETTSEDGEVIEPNLTIYNPLPLESLPDAGTPFIPGTVIDPETIDNPDPKMRKEIAEASSDPLKMNAVYSTNLILVDVDTDEVIVAREAEEVLYPASMSKVLTAICMADYLTDRRLQGEYEMKEEEILKTYYEKFSAVGTTAGDILPAKDLFYGMMVCSGADADYALTHYLAGTEADMVELLNKRAYDMGISDTAHFTNVIGAFDPEHHCTVNDIAVIMSTAIQNPLILDAMSTEQYRTVPTQKDEEGVDISNWFLRRIGIYECNGDVIAAKTGFISEAGFCCVSYLETYSGHHYICVTANSDGNWRTIFDHISLYRAYTK